VGNLKIMDTSKMLEVLENFDDNDYDVVEKLSLLLTFFAENNKNK